MPLFRVCQKCKIKLNIVEFDTSQDIWCRACALTDKRIIEKFDEMVASPVTELRALADYCNEWYAL
jgi:hypothetical protein